MKSLLILPGIVASAALVAEVAADPLAALPWIERLGALVVVAAVVWWLFTRTIPAMIAAQDKQRDDFFRMMRDELEDNRAEWRAVIDEIRADRELDREARHETNRQINNLSLALEIDANETPLPRKRGG